MNRYRTLSFLTALFLTVALAGCEDYLSTLPDNRTTLDSRKKIAQLLVSAYPEAHYAFFTETMSDNARDKGSLPSQNVGATDRDVNALSYEWKDINYEANSNASDAPNTYWAACYTAIASANHALETIETMGEAEGLAPLQGEALLARAYAHFMLVNLWAKQYDSTTAEKDPGIPYVLAPEKVAIKSWKRNTVKEVYDLIEKDIQKGIPLLKNNYDRPRFHFTIEAGHAFATRFYLYKGDWKNVIKHASRILTQDGVNLRGLAGSNYFGRTYNEQAVRYSSSAEPANLLIVSTSSIHARYFFACRYQLTRELGRALVNTQRSLLPSGASWRYTLYGSELFVNRPKFREYFKLTNVSASTGNAYASFVLLSYDEVLLNRAEAYVMTNRFDLARADMALFMSKKATATPTLTEGDITAKYPPDGSHRPYYTLSSLQESYVKAIADLRRLEFLQEGMRWFDIRRFHLPVEHVFSNGGKVMLTADDPRRELKIPGIAVALGLKDNPR